MKQRQSFIINLIVIISLVAVALGVSLVGLTGLAQAASVPVALVEQAGLALPPAAPPIATTLSNNSVAENEASGTTVGTFSTDDPDSASHTFQLTDTVSFPDNVFFAIAGTTLTTNAVFNYEVINSYTIRVATIDSEGEVLETTFAINVTNMNEAPTDIALSNASVNEEQSVNTVVGTFSTTDPDGSGVYTYTLLSGGGNFNINGNQLRTSVQFNYESGVTSYNIQVRTTDSGGLFFDENFTITINNINETPTNITLSSSNVNENRPIGTSIGTFSTTDIDNPDSHTYVLTNTGSFPDNNFFTIVDNQLRTGFVFDEQTKNSYSIRVRTTDAGGLFYDKTFTITINDVVPAITVVKTANPISVPETGANVTFTIRITNTSQENAAITIFSDNKFDLNARCPDAVGTILSPSQVYTCVFTVFLSGDYPGNHQDLATAIVSDNEGNPRSASDGETVTFTDVLPNLSVAYTSDPPNVTEPGGNVTFSVLVTNLSTEPGTLTQLQDSTFGNLNGQGNCALNGTISPNGGTYNCSFTKLVSGSVGQTLVFTATARLADDDSNTKTVTDGASVFIGEMFKVYLPLITKPAPNTDLSVFNDKTGGNVTFTVIGTGVSCTVPNNATLFCGSFSPGTYNVQVVSPCGSATVPKSYDSGPQTTRVFCN